MGPTDPYDLLFPFRFPFVLLELPVLDRIDLASIEDAPAGVALGEGGRLTIATRRGLVLRYRP